MATTLEYRRRLMDHFLQHHRQNPRCPEAIWGPTLLLLEKDEDGGVTSPEEREEIAEKAAKYSLFHPDYTDTMSTTGFFCGFVCRDTKAALLEATNWLADLGFTAIRDAGGDERNGHTATSHAFSVMVEFLIEGLTEPTPPQTPAPIPEKESAGTEASAV